MGYVARGIDASDVLAGITTDSVKWKGADIAAILADTTVIDSEFDLTRDCFLKFNPAVSAYNGDGSISADDNCHSGARLAGSANGDHAGMGSFYLTEATDIDVILIYLKNSSCPIIDIEIDGASIGSVDCYAGSGSYNNETSTNAGSTAAGLHNLKLLVNGKNASSSGYDWSISGCMVVRA